MQELGFNYRITDLQAALGISQLNKIEKFVKRRREIVSMYNEAFKDINWIKIPYENNNIRSAFHLYVLQIDFNRIGKTRKQVMEELKEKNIGTQVHYIPVHIQPFYKKYYGYTWGDYPNSEEYYKKALSIPLYPKLKNREVNYVINKILDLINYN